jgi:lipoate---protein ligase
MDHLLETLHGVIVDYSFADPVDNLCYDDTLLHLAERGDIRAALRFWESPSPFIVLGRSGDPLADLNLASVREDGIPVYRRSSGGGTVVQGPGCLNYALVLPKDGAWQDVRTSYRDISAWLLKTLSVLGVEGGRYEPISDLAIGDRKFSGNAQRRGKHYLLQHGTLLYGFDLARISHWLAQPVAQPPYRRNRSHTDFVTNIHLEIGAWKHVVTTSAFRGDSFETPLPGSLEVLARQRAWGRVETLSFS